MSLVQCRFDADGCVRIYENLRIAKKDAVSLSLPCRSVAPRHIRKEKLSDSNNIEVFPVRRFLVKRLRARLF